MRLLANFQLLVHQSTCVVKAICSGSNSTDELSSERPSGYFRWFASVVQQWAKKLVINFQYTQSTALLKVFPSSFPNPKGVPDFPFKFPRESNFKKNLRPQDKILQILSICLYNKQKQKCTTTPYLLCVFNLLLVFTCSFIHCCIHRTNTISNTKIIQSVPWDFKELKSKLALINPTFHELVKNFGTNVRHMHGFEYHNV